MKRLASAVSLVAIAALLVLPASGGATITVGSDLSRPVTDSVGGAITVLPQVPDTISPVNGTVVGFKVKASPAGAFSWGNVAVRVLRPFGSTFFDGVGTGLLTPVPVATAANTTFTFPAQLPISKGDSVGIDVGSGGNAVQSAPVTGAKYGTWGPSLPDSAPPSAPTPGSAAREVLFNAQIEPTNAFTLGVPLIGKKGTATVVATVPNPGTLAAGSVSDKAVVAKKKKKKKPPLLTRVTATAVGSGPVTLALQVSKAGRKKLREKGKLTVVAKVAYKPTGGTASSQNVVLKLKK
jgi:hypothetical protein